LLSPERSAASGLGMYGRFVSIVLVIASLVLHSVVRIIS
jgi:hypothetical protein